MRYPFRSHSSSRGFTLIEALVALLVLSFGMLAIASFQVTLTRSSDLAKQRTEATRLAQQKMEHLRAYAQVASSTATPHVFNYTDDLVTSTAPEVFASNATFSRTWTVTPNASNTEKWINVNVSWADRAGQPQSVQLLSVISKFDPQDIGTLATGPGGTTVRRPKNRNINVPYPAVTLSGGRQSAFIPPPGNVAYIFDNVSGNIVQSCSGLAAVAPTPVTIASLSGTGTTVTVTTASGHSLSLGNKVTIAGASNAAFNGTLITVAGPLTGVSFTYSVSTPFLGTVTATGGTATQVVTLLTEGLDLSTATGVSCTTLNAYLLSGFVRFDTSNSPTGVEPGSPGSDNDTFPLDASTPLALDVSNAPTPSLGGSPSMTCYSQRQQVVSFTSSSAVTITSVASSGSTVTVFAGHSFVPGDVVAINAVDNAAFIGAFTVVSSTPGTSFTYTLPPPLPTATSGTGGTATKVRRLTVPDGTTVPGYSTVSKFVSYACVVIPVDHDGVAGTPKRWWGKVTLVPNSASAAGAIWAIGTGSGYKVCRFSADYNSTGSISNSEHPLWYRGVTGALDSQNFLVIDHDEDCPTDKPQNLGSPVNLADDTTARHQPVSIDERSFQCPSGGCGGKAFLEPVSTTTDLLMD